MTTCAETDCPFRTFGGWCGLTACIRRNTTTEIGANPGWVIPDDYVKVVRCRDCTAWETGWKPNHSIDDEYFCPMVGFVTSKDWFCAYGERRDSE